MHLGRGFFAAPSVLAAFAASSPARRKVSARRCRPRCSIPACQRRCGERRSRKRFLMEFVRDRSAINSVKALQQLQPPSSPLHGPPPAPRNPSVPREGVSVQGLFLLGTPRPTRGPQGTPKPTRGPRGAEGSTHCLQHREPPPGAGMLRGRVPMGAMRRVGVDPTDGCPLRWMGSLLPQAL